MKHTLERFPYFQTKSKMSGLIGCVKNLTCRGPILNLKPPFEPQPTSYYRDVRSRCKNSVRKGSRCDGQKNGSFDQVINETPTKDREMASES